jgi:periplasmic divalent cation tolerance protein
MQMQGSDCAAIVVFMTAANRGEADRIADLLVSKRLAACVQILPEIRSVYYWKSEIQRESETLLLAKTTKERFAELEREVRSVHSYETPEIVAVEITGGSPAYLNWIAENLAASQ